MRRWPPSPRLAPASTRRRRIPASLCRPCSPRTAAPRPCRAAPPPATPTPGGNALTWRRLDLPADLKQFSNVQQPLFTTAVTQAEWQQLVRTRFSAPSGGPAPALPAVDFGHEFVLAVFAGT